MFYQLPPAGERICLAARTDTGRAPDDLFHPWQAGFYNSGTAALAAAIMAAIRRKGVPAPEVILPAYGCPDLVSAVFHAGARPVLVDLEPQRPWMDLEQLAASVGSQTAAIVAVSLFGIQERMPALRVIAEQSAVTLIEDSAQAFPKNGVESFWDGDLVVMSFGRGKPVSLLGGGAVLYRDEQFRGLLPECSHGTDGQPLQRFMFRLKAMLYNLMSSPHAYWIPAGLPFLHLGETRFHPLSEVECMDDARLGLLSVNTAAFRRRTLRVQSALAGLIGELSARAANLVDLPAVCDTPATRALLRYPLLLDAGRRDEAYNRMNGSGLGVSKMYPAALPGIAGLEHHLGPAGTFPVARDFASRVLTLPVHERVRETDIRAIASGLESAVC
jgi:dTDP-4-amino-4,6-dideoxygalactose transaminase